MAWIVKNSAGTQIERRDEPYLDDTMKRHMEKEVLPRYPTRQAATLPVLHEIQHRHGWIPHQAIEEIAAFLGLDAARVLDTATFYDDFHLQPQGRYLVMVCQSLSCELMGQGKLLDRIRQKLGIEVGQTTPDGKYTLVVGECLGSCGSGPAALVNDRLYENLSVRNIDEVLDALA